MRTAKQQNAVKVTSQGSGAQTVPGKSQEENVCESVNGLPPLSSVLFLRRRPVSVTLVVPLVLVSPGQFGSGLSTPQARVWSLSQDGSSLTDTTSVAEKGVVTPHVVASVSQTSDPSTTLHVWLMLVSVWGQMPSTSLRWSGEGPPASAGSARASPRASMTRIDLTLVFICRLLPCAPWAGEFPLHVSQRATPRQRAPPPAPARGRPTRPSRPIAGTGCAHRTA